MLKIQPQEVACALKSTRMKLNQVKFNHLMSKKDGTAGQAVMIERPQNLLILQDAHLNTCFGHQAFAKKDHLLTVSGLTCKEKDGSSMKSTIT